LTVDLPTLRKDLEITPRFGEGGGFRYLLKEPLSEEIFEFGEEEYFLCQHLDGQSPLNAVQVDFQKCFGIPLTLDQIETFVRQLKSLGLLISATGESQVSRDSIDEVRTRRLCNPDRLLGLLAAAFTWCFSPAFLMGFFVVLVLAIGIAWKYGGEFVYEMRFVWEPGLFILVPIFGVFVINPLGEIAKGVACKHYGGHVYEFGAYFLCRIIPRFYADISDAWWMKKPARMRVLAAGLVCQILLCGICLIGWKNTTPGTNVHDFWHIFTLASLVFFLLNLIPLFRRDGYHLLSTWIEKPDLWNRSRELAKSWILRRPLPEPLTSREVMGFRWYGVLSVGFQYIFLSLIMGLVGYHLVSSMKGIGALMFLAFLYLRFENVLKRQLMRISVRLPFLMNQAGAVKLRRLIWICLLGAIFLIMFIPYPFEAGGGFRLVPVNQVGIRSQVASEIESVLVKEGQWVKKDQPVAVLLGRDQRKRVEELEAVQEDLKARLRLLKQKGKPEEIAKTEQEVKTVAKSLEYSMLQAKRYEKMFKNKAASQEDYEMALRARDLDRERLELAKRNLDLVKSGAQDEEIEALEAEVRRVEVNLAHAQEDLRLTTLVSPADGRIITPYLSQTVGQYLMVGNLFAVVEDASTIMVEIEVPEEDVAEVEIGASVKLRTWAHPNICLKGKVTAIAPVAYEKSERRVKRALSEQEKRIEQREILREKGKVVRVLCELSDTDISLKTDMTGYAKIESEWRPVGIAFTRWLVRFVMVEVWSWIP